MIGILIVTHGGFADGLLNAVELVAGKQDCVKTIGLYHGDGIQIFEENVKQKIKELDTGDGVLIFTDIFGGSPTNTVMKCFSSNNQLRGMTGVNMAMLIQAVMMREGSNLDELCSLCEEVGNQAPILLHKQYQQLADKATDLEDDF